MTTPVTDDDRAQKADELRASFARIRQHVLADPTLSDEGKQQKIATAREQANANIRGLQEEATAQQAAERQRLERLLFGPPALLSSNVSDRLAQDASYRDALDRARRTDPGRPESLLDLLTQAERTGDRLLSRAAMVVGFERDHVDVLNTWSAANPSYEADVDRLYELSHPDDRTSSGLREVLADAFTYASV